MIKIVRWCIEFLFSTVRSGLDILADLLSMRERQRLLVPPPRLMKIYGTSTVQTYIKNGEDFYRDSTEIGHLKPDESVLDIGCGIGKKQGP